MKAQNTFYSYAGTDIVPVIRKPDNSFSVFGTILTLSYSIHRDKHPVRAIGYNHIKGFTAEGMTVGGTLIFAAVNNYPFALKKPDMPVRTETKTKENEQEKQESEKPTENVGVSVATNVNIDQRYRIGGREGEGYFHAHELKPFDIFIFAAPEKWYQGGIIGIKGVTLVDEGHTISIEDIISEYVYSYMAVDIVPIDLVDLKPIYRDLTRPEGI